MTLPLTPTQVFLAIEPIDIRMGIDGLSLRVQSSLGKAPCNGSVYAFRNKSSNRIKLLVWDGTGVWCATRRLHKGRFVWPHSDAVICSLNQDDWHWLTMGLEWQRLSARPNAHWEV
jgi:transposase